MTSHERTLTRQRRGRPSTKAYPSFLHPVAVVRQATRRRAAGADETGFTLIELLVVVVILPVVVGGIAIALLSVFGLQTQTTNRISDSNDEQAASASFNRDVQSAQEITTQSTPGCGTTSQTQLLGLEWGTNSAAAGGYQTVVSYVSTPIVNANSTTTYTMSRQVCTSGASTNPSNSYPEARDIGSNPSLGCSASATSTLCITGKCPTSPTIASCPPTPLLDISNNFASWATAQGVTGITFKIVAPGSNYTYSLVGLPGLSTSQGSVSSLTDASGPGCNFASSGSGTYANHLCFADFAGFNAASYLYPAPCDLMKRPIKGTPYTLQFCLSVDSTKVAPAAIPTYYSPSGNGSEAFLGNNGFYTGVAGDPALYTTASGVVTAYFTNIQVLDSAGNPATGWTLVTGDAESTDPSEWNVYTSNLNWSILPNNGSSNLWGNACYDTNDPNNSGVLRYTGTMPATVSSVAADRAALSINSTTYATGVPSILCEASTSLNKTGTLMLQAQEPSNSSTAQTLTVSMNGSGLQAIFLGVLL